MSPIDADVPMEHYIPTGCLDVSLSRNSQFSSITEVPKAHLANVGWVDFELGSSTSTQPSLGLDHELENCLSQWLQPFHSLLAKQWIKIRFRTSLDDPDRLILRVYCLPDDVERRRVDRTPEKLRKSRKELLSQLDYAYTKWEGRVGYDRLNTPRYFDNWLNLRDDKEQSLLELFNSLPSPDPQPDKIDDLDTQDIVRWLLEKNDLHGMWTKLYPYQQRSVAMMIQRESQQHKVLDARYVKVVDQEGGRWYYDRITGTSLKHAPMYDSVCGGILAEEMGSGKTLMCLALVLATLHQSSRIPDIWRDRVPYRRKKIGSLADMAAATATRNGSPWRLYFDHNQGPLEFAGCLKAIDRNPGYYYRPTFSLGSTRSSQAPPPPKKIWLSHTTLIIVPGNLMKQWKHEIAKHTTDLKYIAVERLDPDHDLPPLQEILRQDVLLISNSVFECLGEDSELTKIHFKRCIVDEGHRLGSSYKSNRRKVLESLHITARWIASGTPAKGLYGVDRTVKPTKGRSLTEESAKQEAEDLKRLGGLATQYLKLMPFCYTDTDWSTYVMQPRHSNRSSGTLDTLRSIMETLIIRHRTDELSKHLPKVNEKVVLLDGSYQDKLSLNLFSMMIIFNAVQSERKDQDYFFHERQRSALLQLVSNMKQASFFGGGFFPPETITGATETADKFLKESKVQISSTDEVLLRQAIAFGHGAARNHLKQLSAQSHMIPIYIKDFPGRAEDRRAWSLDDKMDDPVCIHSELVEAMQKYLRPMIDAPYNLETKFKNGDFELQGNKIRESKLAAAAVTETGPGSGPTNSSPTAKKGVKTSASTRMSRISLVEEDKVAKDEGVADALLKARVISTASAKLTYLIDQIVKYQQDEQIIVFYEHDNSAYYIASMLETLQIQHLIYANSVRVDRRAQYIDTFNYNLKFRVMLMDLRCAAFGLDLRNASRVYFLHPVLDTQVEAQAIGRARRICQTKDVTVETLVLKDSFEAFLVERRQQMTAGEQRQCKSILDDKPIKEFIENAKLIPLPETEDEGLSQTVMLKEPQFVFGRTFARAFMRGVDNPDEDLVALPSPTRLRAVRVDEPPSGTSDATGDDIQYEKKGKRPRKRMTSTVGTSATKRKRVGFAAESSSASGSSTTPTTPLSASNGTEIIRDVQQLTVASVKPSVFGP